MSTSVVKGGPGLMLQISPELAFGFEATADGSPTVRVFIGEENVSQATSGGYAESMHSFKGALAETVYVYGTALEAALKAGTPVRVLSMGLGLGYVEILATALFLAAGNRACSGESFELLPELRSWFAGWLTDPRAVPREFLAIYDQILEHVGRQTGQDPPAIKNELSEMIRDGRWLVQPALTAETQFPTPFNCICFDAFSAKSSPTLWTDEFLTSFLNRAAAPHCVFSTYACIGALKRALRTNKFKTKIRHGFASKRDSTFAFRPVQTTT